MDFFRWFDAWMILGIVSVCVGCSHSWDVDVMQENDNDWFQIESDEDRLTLM